MNKRFETNAEDPGNPFQLISINFSVAFAIINFMRQILTNDFWGLHKNMNCAFSLKSCSDHLQLNYCLFDFLGFLLFYFSSEIEKGSIVGSYTTCRLKDRIYLRSIQNPVKHLK